MSIFSTVLDTSKLINPAAILEDSYQNQNPFGVPTIVFRSEEFLGFSKKQGRLHRFSRADMVDHIRERLNEFFNHQSGISSPQKDNIVEQYVAEASEQVLVQIVSNLVVPQHIQSGCIPFPFKSINGPFAHQCPENDFEEAMSGLVFTFPEFVNGKAYGESMMSLSEGELPDMPGSVEEWQFLLLWHEFAHTTGAGEPQADKMAAIVTRKAFARSDVIRALADQRMVTSVLNHHQDINVRYYGLPLVENLDEVAAMSQEQVRAFNEGDVKDIRFEKHDYREHKVKGFGQKLARVFPSVFEDIRTKKRPTSMDCLVDFKQEAERLIGDGELQNDSDATLIANRFVCAIDRLSVGKSAYAEPS